MACACDSRGFSATFSDSESPARAAPEELDPRRLRRRDCAHANLSAVPVLIYLLGLSVRLRHDMFGNSKERMCTRWLLAAASYVLCWLVHVSRYVPWDIGDVTQPMTGLVLYA